MLVGAINKFRVWSGAQSDDAEVLMRLINRDPFLYRKNGALIELEQMLSEPKSYLSRSWFGSGGETKFWGAGVLLRLGTRERPRAPLCFTTGIVRWVKIPKQRVAPRFDWWGLGFADKAPLILQSQSL